MNVYMNANDTFMGWVESNFELHAGVIDSTARWVFQHGQCHSLALALHERTGWDLVGLRSVDWGDDPDDHYDDFAEQSVGHVAVRTPEGDIIDIEGRYSETDSVALWSSRLGQAWWVDVTADEAYDAFGGNYREPEVEIASYWVDPLLALTGPARIPGDPIRELDPDDESPFQVVGEIEVEAA